MTKLGMFVSLAVGFAVTYSVATARLPVPNDEAKAKAAEAAAKSAHVGKVDNYKLCLSMNKVASQYLGQSKVAGKPMTPTPTPECADPGPYVSPSAAAAPTPAVVPGAAAGTATTAQKVATPVVSVKK